MAFAPHGQRGHDYFTPAMLSNCYRSRIYAVILRFYRVKVKTFRMQGSLQNTTTVAPYCPGPHSTRFFVVLDESLQILNFFAPKPDLLSWIIHCPRQIHRILTIRDNGVQM
ncbi:hypothetical protein L873DRAFT_1824293 [Choiromyces venosus 120613-1]|uniref:Uncharacterized protein n=1 Tax=Choiromyces venosus 120613-1 TaxID=1336337 RepID=A0A3N4IQY7_9PEZI|nr:hypothetical protein L873DRAFT_1824293 [Choiromyces venosus 120613-1]